MIILFAIGGVFAHSDPKTIVGKLLGLFFEFVCMAFGILFALGYIACALFVVALIVRVIANHL